jgi:hypothetical protein
VTRKPAPLPRLVALAACAALVHCNHLLHALFVRPSFDLSATRVTLRDDDADQTFEATRRPMLITIPSLLFLLSLSLTIRLEVCPPMVPVAVRASATRASNTKGSTEWISLHQAAKSWRGPRAGYAPHRGASCR